jgi:undecaprenyl-diphosphatase
LNSPPLFQAFMNAGFFVGDQLIAGLTIILGLYFVYKHLWRNLAMLTIGMVGASSLFLSLSHYFARPRPPTQIWIVLNIPGFPSGHAISTVVFYGLAAYLLVPKLSSAFWKWIVIAAALLIILYVGFSRIFTGGHYLTDILAGYGLGIAWSGLAFTVIELVAQKLRSRNVQKE